MKTLSTTPLEETIKFKCIRRNEIDWIIGRLQGANYKLTIDDGDFEYSNLDEVASQVGNNPKRLVIQAQGDTEESPFRLSIRIALYPMFVVISTMSNESVDQAIGREIEAYIRKLPSRFRANAVLFWLVVFAAFQFVLVNVDLPITASAVLNALGGVMIAWGALSIPVGLSLERRHSNFFSRNRDHIFLLLLGAIIGALITKGIPAVIDVIESSL